MNRSADTDVTDAEARTVSVNLSTRYLAIGVEMLVGLLVLPFNVAHLGKAAYGLWMLTTSVTAYFSVLDLGYSGAIVKFVAEHRARRDTRALNEVLSTTFYLFAGFAVVAYLVAIVIAVFLGRLLHIGPDQLFAGRVVLLVTSVNVAFGMTFTVFGGVINGFQRYDLNNVTGAISSVIVAVVNVLVLVAGYGLIALVVATTTVRVLTYWVYRANAYRVFPALAIRLANFRASRLRALTSFSVFMMLIDWANRINYSIDAIVIGMILDTSAVAVWSIGQRLAETTQRLTNQLNDILFPNVVDHSASSRLDRLQTLFLVATRLSLATVVPIGVALILMADLLVRAWVGPDFSGSVVVVRLLALAVMVRVGTAVSGTLLKGAGAHQFVAYTNVVTAIVNLALSIVLARTIGLAGVAIGTLVPVGFTGMFVIFPTGCRRVGLPITRALADAVWPAIWPAAAMAAYLALTRPLLRASLAAVLATMALSVVVYAAAFLAFGVSATERRFVLSRVFEVTARVRVLRPSPQGQA
ncbi:MAG TPA: oligosaccharide flippase family protein [Vicinamibacterales bacterium]|nr:oligosaccharide flippase family protein [Vicinamibacterales bacterium]